MKNITLLFVLMWLINSGCIIESETIYTATINNNTDHKIVVFPYNNNVVMPQDSIVLTAKQSLQIANGSDRGINNNAGFHSDYFADCDSVLVKFDDSLQIAHYLIEPANKNQKFYFYESIRNILNIYSYEYYYTDKSKYRRESFYTYTFTEQDYLDAKN